jgi:hypothetical protein
MFCEDPEEIAMVNHLCSVYPHSEEYIIDLMVWCWRHKNAEYTRIMEKYSEYKGLEEEMMTLEPILDWSAKDDLSTSIMINGELLSDAEEREIKENNIN